MGYDVNYNAADYADSRDVCDRVYADLQAVEQLLIRASLRADQGQQEVERWCVSAGIAGRGTALGVAADRIRFGYQHCAEAVIEARRLAEAVGAAMQNYEQAEAVAEKMMLHREKIRSLWSILRDTRDNDYRPPTERMETMLGLLMLANPRHLGSGRSLEDILAETTREVSRSVDEHSATTRGEVELVEVGAPETVRIEGGLDSYAQLHRLLHDGGAQEHGKILIARTDPHTYVVIIPGTQPGFDGTNPFDAKGIVDAFGYESMNYAPPIDRALESSGAGPGDEVILSGYSQGGIHTAFLMNSPLLTRKYRMTKMLTLGSPIGQITVPKEVHTLSLEDAKDMVPGTDGTPNHTSDRQTTVTFDGPRQELAGQLPQEGVFGAPHSLQNYEDHLRELQQTHDPQVQERIKEFTLLAGPLVIRRFTLERRKAKKPEKDRARPTPGQPDAGSIAPPH